MESFAPKQELEFDIKDNGYNTDISIYNQLYPSNAEQIKELLLSNLDKNTNRLNIVFETTISINSSLISILNKIEDNNPNRFRIIIKDQTTRILLQSLNKRYHKSVKFNFS